MSMFKKAFKAVAKPVKSAVKSTVKNAVPLTAAFLTGGASLTVLKPSGGLFDKAYGAVGMGPPKEGASIEQVATDYAQEKITNEANRFVNRQLNPKQNTSSKRINSQTSYVSKPMTESVSESFDSVSRAVGGKSKLFMIGGGLFAVVLLFLFIGRVRK